MMDDVQFIVHRSDDYLAHHGVKGQKWGIRRFQNEDGSLTAEGKQKYGAQQGWEARQMYKRGEISRADKRQAMKAKGTIGKIDNVLSLGMGRRMREFESRHRKGITAATAALGVAGTIAVGVLTGGAAPAIVSAGASAIGSTLGTHLRTKYVNKAILNYGYNKTNKELKKSVMTGVANTTNEYQRIKQQGAHRG